MEFDLDCSYLRTIVAPDRIPLRGNEHRITRVAFDLFKFDEDKEHLWQIQADDDGNEFLVRTYELPKEDIQVKSDWNVVEDGKKASLTIAYKGMPIHRLVTADYGAATPGDVGLLRDLFQAKLADDAFAGRFLMSLPESKRAALVAAFPKIASIVPKIPTPVGKDPLEGIEPPNPKEEWHFDPKAKSQLPTWQQTEKHPQNAEDEKADRPSYPELLRMDRNNADDMYRLAQLAYVHGVDWTESEMNIPVSQLVETVRKATEGGQTVIRVAPKDSKHGILWFLKGKIAKI
jgi:hypothetical protein